MKQVFMFLATLIVVFQQSSSSRVLELSDKFADVRKDGGHWLVMFYAPWCGHCKRLEPVWAHVAQSLYKTNIRVGRIDCTRFTSITSEFKVSGFPTIKFIKGEDEYTFHGDRTKDDILNFAKRMSGPPVQELTRADSMNSIKTAHQLFFMYVGSQDGPLWNVYHGVATRLQAHGFFYSASTDIAKQHVDIDELPAVFVYKESLHYFYSVDSGNSVADAKDLNDTMYNWINEERFETFPKITRGNINDIMQTKKYLVLVVVEENKLREIPAEMIEFRDMVESVIRKKRDKFHKNFQFGWIASPELANSIAMTVLPLPYLLVLNSTTNHHHIPEDDPAQLTAAAVDLFLERIYNQSVTTYGGNSYTVQLYRYYFEARSSLAEMWRGNPVLTTVLFGLPFGFLSLILYSICCSDILDADEEEDEDSHEKRE
ncbi:PREDICTED: protein disulfide-isomerase TMX3 [Nicrophorus vespilloides]|uniref:Protein disulfide-isomerase TMX3 n=1 Tax=Nicrophorus vespilloides TaxID=110193 RepID=A0ABM1MU32_NICVS|nr:PREDICTED: protein disulfide-isomerase TMX3 [Nicrophorus vespilloides]